MDFITAFTAVHRLASTTPGPGLGQVGPATNYAGAERFPDWICTLAMFLGRIELFTFLVLFTPHVLAQVAPAAAPWPRPSQPRM